MEFIYKMKLSAWDWFTLFFSGLTLLLIMVLHTYQINSFDIIDYINDLKTTLLIYIPFVVIIAGLFLEPLATYTNSILNNNFKFISQNFFSKIRKEEKFMIELVEEKYLENLKGGNTYYICKEYVEGNKLGNEHFACAARYGFYRNVWFICLVSSALTFLWNMNCYTKIVIAAGWIIVSIFFKYKAEESTLRQKVSILRCFIIDKSIEFSKKSWM